MELRTLYYVTAIAKYKNLTKAAEALYVGQPTLSKFLVSLEDELGLKLFKKAGNKYLLTYAGERFVEKAEQIIRMKEDLQSEMSDIVKDDIGVLSIAFANMRCTYTVPKTLPVFRRKYPNVKINLSEGHSAVNDRRLIDGEIDAAFYTLPRECHPRIEYHSLAKEELLICTSHDHPVKKYAEENKEGRYPLLSMKSLKDELVILMRPEQRTRQIVDDIMGKNNISYENLMYTSSIPTIIGLVSEGFGVSFVFEPHLKHRIDNSPIDCYSIKEGRIFSEFVAATRKGSYLSHYTKDYIEIVRSAAQELSKEIII